MSEVRIPDGLAPPSNEAPVADDGQHTQAWNAHFQDVASTLRATADALNVMRTGTVLGDNAAAGQIGEYLLAGYGSGVSLASATPANLITLALTPGDWDVDGAVVFNPTGTVIFAGASINTVSAAFGAIATRVGSSGTGTQLRMSAGGALRINTAVPVTAYLVGECGYSTGTCTAQGRIWARRAR